MKDSFIAKIMCIIFANAIWCMAYIVSAMSLESSYPTRTIAFFILEPICMFIIVPLISHIVVFVAERKLPKCNRTDSIILRVFDVVLCIVVYILLLMNYSTLAENYEIGSLLITKCC